MEKINNDLPCVIESRAYYEAVGLEQYGITLEDLARADKSPSGFIKQHNGINFFITKPITVKI